MKAAFLNCEVDREIYVGHPRNLPAELSSNVYYKLVKALYGLKQAPACWFEKLYYCFIHKLQYKQLQSDCAVFLRRNRHKGRETFVLVLVYVDDMIFVSNSTEVAKDAVHQFLSEFEGTRDGDPKWYLGVRIETTYNRRKLSQTAYIDQILEEYGLEGVREYITPMTKNFYEELKESSADELVKEDNYANMIGALMYLANKTRPDISTAVGILAQYTAKPTRYLHKCVQRVMGYLKATREFGLVQRLSENPILEFYCDSDFAGERTSRKSRTGWIALFNGSALSWTSHKQTCVALSTAEAEYISMSDCCKEIRWLRLFLAEIGIIQNDPMILLSDNVAAQRWAQSTHTIRRAKHIDVRYHYVRQCVQEN